ncbi:MAG: ATP-dependent DNA helicase RecQ [Bacteroidota bacterium]
MFIREKGNIHGITLLKEAQAILKQYWGYEDFRPVQGDIVDAVLSDKDVLALLPTGGGKSICFQVPALLKDGLCIVVTPLIALMRDQVDQLTKRGIKATAIYSGMNKKAIDTTLDNCIYGNIKFLYVSPERLLTDLFLDRVQKMKVNLLAIDEAHCISQWGYDFRPAYLQIAELRDFLPNVNVLALTATATPKVQDDIVEKLTLREAERFQKSFARKNLSYSIRKVEDKESKLVEILSKIPGTSIIYGDTRKSTKEIAKMLRLKGLSVDFYHAGLDQVTRSAKQDRWLTGKTRIMVSTNAFGMGIDKPDVRSVVHLHIPYDIESYYQEAGRAGRDEKKAFSVVLYHQNDIDNLRKRVSQQHPPVETLKRVYQCLANYYQLAIGSGQGQSYDMDIHGFSEKYDLDHLEAFYSLKKLEESGLIQFNESFHNPSQLHIEVNHTELYKFQVANASLDVGIKALLRIYGGELYNSFMRISESQIAQFLNISESEVITFLQRLDKKGIVNYTQKKDKPQVLFLQPRHDINALPLDTKRLKLRAEIAEEKTEAIINYVQDQNVCRTKLLLKYLGEINFDECGVCDNCLNNRKEKSKKHEEDYLHQVSHIIEEKPSTVEEIIHTINPPDQDVLLEVIREMVDAGIVQYDGQWRLFLSS